MPDMGTVPVRLSRIFLVPDTEELLAPIMPLIGEAYRGSWMWCVYGASMANLCTAIPGCI